MTVVGIDLAGVEKRDTGFCILNTELRARTSILHTDQEIINAVVKARPAVVAIDAPLCLPKGRRSLEKKSNIHFRQCDRDLWKMGIKFFPITLGPMRKLTKRGIELKKKLEKRRLRVIEVYPGGAQDLLKIPRKNRGLGLLKVGLEKFGIKRLSKNMTGDELDAVTCALVGRFFLKRHYTALGDQAEGLIIMPVMPKI